MFYNINFLKSFIVVVAIAAVVLLYNSLKFYDHKIIC